MRDDLLLNHFVPEFSPIVAHAWLLRYGIEATFIGDTTDVRRRAAENAPWLSLNRAWSVRVGGPDGMGEGFLLLNFKRHDIFMSSNLKNAISRSIDDKFT